MTTRTTRRQPDREAETRKRPFGHRIKRSGSAEAESEQVAGGKSQSELAAMYGVTRAMISKIERRALRKIREAVESAADEAGLTVGQWLFGDEA